MTTSIIEGIQTFIKTYGGVASNPVWVDYLGQTPTEYAINPLPGARIVESYLNGGSVREFPFVFQRMESTAEDETRLGTCGFFEAFADWLEDQTEAGTLPTLPTGKTAEKIEALGWGYLMQQGVSSTAVYQIQCKLTYEQE